MDTQAAVSAALADLTKSVGSRIDALEANAKEYRQEVEDYLVKANRPNLAWGDSSSGQELKALNNAARALILGDQRKADEYFIEAKAMIAGSDPSGGYVVHDVMSTGMTKILAEISPIYRLSRRIALPRGGAFEEPIDRDAAEASWVGEVAARPDTDTPDLAKFRVELNEIYAMPKASQTLIDIASIDVLGWLQGKIGEAFATKEGYAFHNGTGVAQPRGILTFTTVATPDSSRTWGEFEHVKTGTNGAFPTASTTVNAADVLVDVTGALKPQYRTGAVWLMNRLTAAVVRKLKDADGRHVWVDSLIQGQPSVLLGYPVEIDEEMPDIATDSLSIAFGNISKAYTIIEQPGTKFLTDPFTDKPNVRLFAYRRVGGGVSNFESIKFLKFAA